MGIGSDRDKKKLHKRDSKADCVIAQEIYDKIAGGRALDYDLDLFDDDFGYISAMDFRNGILVLCHSKLCLSYFFFKYPINLILIWEEAAHNLYLITVNWILSF